jgi:hypothetical protein
MQALHGIRHPEEMLAPTSPEVKSDSRLVAPYTIPKWRFAVLIAFRQLFMEVEQFGRPGQSCVIKK